MVQVCSYRCLASYENPILQDFSLCILQKHNCLGLSAEIPMVPEVLPMPTFRGAPMSFDAADDVSPSSPLVPSLSLLSNTLVKDMTYVSALWSARVSGHQARFMLVFCSCF